MIPDTETTAALPGNLFSGPPRYQAASPWGPWSALAACLLIIAGQIATAVLALQVFKTFTTIPVSDSDLQTLKTPAGLAVVLVSQITAALVVWLLAGRNRQRAEVLSLLPPKSKWSTGVLGGLLVVGVTGLVELFLYAFIKYDYLADSQAIADGLKSPLWLGTALMAVVFAPLWEELTFRGFLLSALAQTRLGFWPAALISNSIWTALHAYSPAGIASVFTAGLVLSWLMWRTGSMRVPVIAHATANLFAVGFAYFMHA